MAIAGFLDRMCLALWAWRTMAPLRCATKFDPFLPLDCAPTPSTLAQSEESKGSNFAIWQPLGNLQYNPIEDAITECQNDGRCKAIVAAWGSVPDIPFGKYLADQRQNMNIIIDRKNHIANKINTVASNQALKGGYIDTLTSQGSQNLPRFYPRHPRTQGSQEPNAQFAQQAIPANVAHVRGQVQLNLCFFGYNCNLLRNLPK